MQEEVNNKTVALAIRTSKLTARALGMAIRKYMNSRSQKKSQKINIKNHQKAMEKKLGKVSVKELAAMDAGMTNIEINSNNIKAFERYAQGNRKRILFKEKGCLYRQSGCCCGMGLR